MNDWTWLLWIICFLCWTILEALKIFLEKSFDIDLLNSNQDPTLESCILTLDDIGNEWRNELIVLSDFGIIPCISQNYKNKFEQIDKFGESCAIDNDPKKPQRTILNRFSFKFAKEGN